MRKGARGQGSIRKRPDDVWEARFTVGTDPKTGRQIQKSVYGSSQKEVRKKLTAITRALDTDSYADTDNMTLKSWLLIWLDAYVRDSVKHSTYVSYETDCRVHIIPNLGRIKLQSLKAPMIQAFYKSLLRSGKSPKTVKNIHGVLHRALKKAVTLGYLYNNQAEQCELPKIEKKEIKPLPEPKIKEFLAAVESHRFRDIYIVTLFTGLREGEVLGLTWDSIDFDRGSIHINKQLQLIKRSGGAYKLVPTKTSRTRTLFPADYVMEIFKKLHTEDSKYNEWNLVFVNKETGAHLAISTVYKNYKRLVRDIGIPEARVHDLRHTYAVISLQEGDNIKFVQNSLGHATAAFTLDVYGHVSRKMEKESKERMDKFIVRMAE